MAAGGGGLNLNMQETIVRLQESAAELATELNGLSDAQWAWRGEAGRWTVREIVEHLILVEGKLLFLLRRTMQMPAVERTAPLTDVEVWERLVGTERQRAEAPERVRPTGVWLERLAAMAELGRLRAETIGYAETTADPLRERWLRLPVGEVDGVQTLIMMAGHSLRHLKQIRELRTTAGFPEDYR